MIKTVLTAFFAALCLVSSAQVKIVCHRGYHLEENTPENSLASLKASQRIGADASEFDVWLTKDGKVVINHDAKFKTDSEGRIIKESNFEDLRDIRLSNGEEIPTFEAYLNQAKECSGTMLCCELKRHGSDSLNFALVDACVALAREAGLMDQIVWQGFGWNQILHLRKIAPEATILYLCSKEDKFKTPEQIKKAGLNGVNYKAAIYDAHPDFISNAHGLGLVCDLCTEDKPEILKKFISIGIDMVGTNKPLQLFEILGRE